MEKSATAIRYKVGIDIRAAGGRCLKSRCLLGARGEAQAAFNERFLSSSYQLWQAELESDFCLEPPGDTLTRAHFYMSVQAGCIPVIFDAAAGQPRRHIFSVYDHTQTAWAWRDRVPFDSLVVRLPWPLNGSIVDHLDRIPANELRAMRRSLDQYAKLTIYGPSTPPHQHGDAFAMLLGVLSRGTLGTDGGG